MAKFKKTRHGGKLVNRRNKRGGRRITRRNKRGGRRITRRNKRGGRRITRINKRGGRRITRRNRRGGVEASEEASEEEVKVEEPDAADAAGADAAGAAAEVETTAHQNSHGMFRPLLGDRGYDRYVRGTDKLAEDEAHFPSPPQQEQGQTSPRDYDMGGVEIGARSVLGKTDRDKLDKEQIRLQTATRATINNMVPEGQISKLQLKTNEANKDIVKSMDNDVIIKLLEDSNLKEKQIDRIRGWKEKGKKEIGKRIVEIWEAEVAGLLWPKREEEKSFPAPAKRLVTFMTEVLELGSELSLEDHHNREPSNVKVGNASVTHPLAVNSLPPPINIITPVDVNPSGTPWHLRTPKK
jgi:hypothetical protein